MEALRSISPVELFTNISPAGTDEYEPLTDEVGIGSVPL